MLYESNSQIDKKCLSTHKNWILKNLVWVIMKSYVLLLAFILIAFDEKLQVTGDGNCEKLCPKKSNIRRQCYKNSICWQTVIRCIRQRKCPPTAPRKHFDTVKIIPIELPALWKQRTEHIKLNHKFPIFKLKNVAVIYRVTSEKQRHWTLRQVERHVWIISLLTGFHKNIINT